MTLHHQKHHNTYITNLNTLLTAQSTAQATNNVPELIALQAKIKFHGGGHINHSLFWTNLAPYNAPETDLAAAAPALQEAIRGEWGSVGAFREAFRGVLLGVQGSGWGWLVKRGERLEIVVTKDQDPVVGGVPVLGVDMWEHAYYLQYLNDKASYVNGIWSVVNWKTAEERYLHGIEQSFLLKL